MRGMHCYLCTYYPCCPPWSWSWSFFHFLLRLFIAANSFLLAEMLRPSLSDLSFFYLRCGPSLSIELIVRIFIKCSSRSSSGTFSSKVSILAFAFTGAESIAWVWPLTMPFSTHMASTLVNTSSKTDSGNSCRVRLMVLCHGSSSSRS